MSIDSSPPAQPPQMSPDKKWFWDGAAWRPIPVHEAAFPNWKGIGSGFTPEVAAPAAVAPVRRAVAPTPAYRMAGPAPDVAAPRWNTQPPVRAKVRKFGVMAAGVGVLIAVVALVSVLATMALTARPAAQPQAAASPTPGPATRSDSAWASYVVKSLTSPMADLKDTTSQTRTTCVVGMTSSCADTVQAIGNQVAAILPLLDKATIPLCIAAQETRLHADLTAMNAGAQLAFKGFHDNKKSEFASGLGQVNSLAGQVQNDFVAVSKAAPGCDSQVTGP